MENDKITLGELAAFAMLWMDDLWHVHHHCVGSDFHTNHAELLDEYYNQAKDDRDYICETAIRKGFEVKNGAEASSVISTEVWQPETKEAYNTDQVIEFLKTKGSDWLEALQDVRSDLGDEDTDIQSELDSILSFWRTEIDYKNEMRSQDGGEEIPENDEIASENNFISDEEGYTPPPEVANSESVVEEEPQGERIPEGGEEDDEYYESINRFFPNQYRIEKNFLRLKEKKIRADAFDEILKLEESFYSGNTKKEEIIDKIRALGVFNEQQIQEMIGETEAYKRTKQLREGKEKKCCDKAECDCNDYGGETCTKFKGDQLNPAGDEMLDFAADRKEQRANYQSRYRQLNGQAYKDNE
jgi:DNA-binding ferritin-like protein